MNNWADEIVARYDLVTDWNLSKRQREEILADFIRECPEDVPDVFYNMPDKVYEQIVTDPLSFSYAVYDALWAHVVAVLEGAVESYIP